MKQLPHNCKSARLAYVLVFVVIGLAWMVPQSTDATCPQDKNKQAVSEETVFGEKDGIVAVEAEHFFAQTKVQQRQFYLTTKDETPSVGADGDPNHWAGASGGGYLESLPDTRRTHDDKLTRGENFFPSLGKSLFDWW